MPDPEHSPAAHCPICSRLSDAKQRPFCSVRCADADLGRWLTGAYRVPGPALELDEANASGRSVAGRLDPEDDVG